MKNLNIITKKEMKKVDSSANSHILIADYQGTGFPLLERKSLKQLRYIKELLTNAKGVKHIIIDCI